MRFATVAIAAGALGLAFGAMLGRSDALGSAWRSAAAVGAGPAAEVPQASVPAGASTEGDGSDAAELRRTVARLESETEALQRELLRLELAALASGPVASTTSGPRRDADPLADVGDARGAGAGAGGAALIGSDAGGVSDPGGVPDTGGVDAGPVDPGAAVAALAEADLALAALVPGPPGEPPWAHEIDAARRAVADRLVATLGIDALAAARHERGEPNRLVVVGASGPGNALRAGDVVVSIDGTHVIDAERVRWLGDAAADRADDAGESLETHVIDVLRDGQPLSVGVDASLGSLVFEERSISPDAFE